MTELSLNEANELVLQKISISEGNSILGFLPLNRTEEESILTTVRQVYADSIGRDSLQRLTTRAPAAITYALAVAPARSLSHGGQFWPALEEDLGIS